MQYIPFTTSTQPTNPYGSQGSTPTDYVNQFMNTYGNLSDALAGKTYTPYNVGNAGQGIYNFGNAGQGMFDPNSTTLAGYNLSNIGTGTYDASKSPLANYNIGGAGMGMFDVGSTALAGYNMGDSGKGQYTSDLLNQYATMVSKNMSNPDTSLAMGLARDQISGNENVARQALFDQNAGWGRGSGIAQSQMNQLNSSLAGQKSDAQRQIAIQTQQDAMNAAQNLEAMRGTQFEQSKARDLQSAIAQGDVYKVLASLQGTAFDQSKNRDLANAVAQGDINKANAIIQQSAYESGQGRQQQGAIAQGNIYGQLAGLQSNAYSDAMSRALQGAQLGSNNYNDSMARALQAAGLNSSNYNNAQGLQSGNYNTQAGMLSPLSNMLQAGMSSSGAGGGTTGNTLGSGMGGYGGGMGNNAPVGSPEWLANTTGANQPPKTAPINQGISSGQLMTTLSNSNMSVADQNYYMSLIRQAGNDPTKLEELYRGILEANKSHFGSSRSRR